MSCQRNVCPVCGHRFMGNGFDGIDAHWRAHHEDEMPYEEAWPLISSGSYPPPKITAACSLPPFRRPDGQGFDINARLYELPDASDHWTVSYDVHNKEWGHMHFRLEIPKEIAPTSELAELIVEGGAFEQVKAALMRNSSGC
jgi:hypothetical protein